MIKNVFLSNILKAIAIVACVATTIVSIACILIVAVLFSSCGKDEDTKPSVKSVHPSFSLQIPASNWDSGVLTPVDTTKLVDNNTQVGMRYTYTAQNFNAVVNVDNQQKITQLTGSVGFYTYYVNLSDSIMHLCNGGGSYPITYKLIY